MEYRGKVYFRIYIHINRYKPTQNKNLSQGTTNQAKTNPVTKMLAMVESDDLLSRRTSQWQVCLYRVVEGLV